MSSRRPAALSVSLPQALRKFVDQRVRTGGFGNVSEYIRTLIRADQGAGLPGVGGLRRPAGRALAVAEGGPANAADPAADLTTDDWRELRDALLRGGAVLHELRLVEAAGLFRSALLQVAARVRQTRPDATAAEVAAAQAAWVHQEEAWDHGHHLQAAPERLRGILDG